MKSDDEGDTPVFPSAVTQRSLSNGSMLRVLDRMGRGALTVQGFRATFKTWASERTSFQNEVVEASRGTNIFLPEAYTPKRPVTVKDFLMMPPAPSKP